MMRLALLSTFVLPWLCFGVSSVGAQERTSVQKGKIWSAYTLVRQKRRICYVEATPGKKRGAARERTNPYVQVMHRMGPRGRKRDIVDIGFFLEWKVKSGQPVLVEVGRRHFRLVPRDTRAILPGDKENRRLLRAMILGKVLVLRGQSAGGRKFEDTYSLTGFARAYYAARAACGLKVPTKKKKKKAPRKPRRR